MRILRLDLLAFGPFTARSLDFSAEGALHIVYGHNEAGKSSSLRALRQWLYGIPAQSADDFVHPYPNLRIGGELVSSDGRRLAFVRRKGNNKTIRSPVDDQPLDDAQLEAMLGGVDAAAFEKRFGIDHEELRRGGKALVEGGGDLKEILFAAGAGIADLGRVHKRLDEEAATLFKPRGVNQRINDGLKQFHEARKLVKDSLLPSAKWEECANALEEDRKKHQRIGDQLKQKRTTKSRLERFREALPIIGQLELRQQQYAEVKTAPLLPDDFSSRRSEIETRLDSERRNELSASQEIDALEQQLEASPAASHLLDHRTSIKQLEQELGVYLQAVQDRPRLVAEQASDEKEAQRILADLGGGFDIERAEKLRLTKQERQLIQSLSRDFKARVEEENRCNRDVRKLETNVNAIEEELAKLPPVKDATRLAVALREAQKRGDLDARLESLRRELATLEADGAASLAKLPLWSGTLEQLESAQVPLQETVDRHLESIAGVKGDIGAALARLQEAEKSVEETQRQLDSHRREHDTPTAEELAEARCKRSDLWRLVRECWLHGLGVGDSQVTGFLGGAPSLGDLSAAYEESVRATDEIADRLLRDANGVAFREQLCRDLEVHTQRRKALNEELNGLSRRLEQAQADWRDAWKNSGVTPLSPVEMQAWLREQRDLQETAASIRAKRQELELAESTVESLTNELRELAIELCPQNLPVEMTFGRLVEHCQVLIERTRSAESVRNTRKDELAKSRAALVEATTEAADAAKKLEDWRKNWARAVASLGLDGVALPDEVQTIVGSVDEAIGLLDKVRGKRVRIEEIDEYSRKFKESVRNLVAQLAEDLLELPVERQVADLNDRLAAADQNDVQRRNWNNQLEGEKRKLREARLAIDKLAQSLASLQQQAGCAAPEKLPAAEARSRQRRDLEKDLDHLQSQLSSLACGEPLDDWIAEAKHFRADDLCAELNELSQEIERLENEQSEVNELIGQRKAEFDRMDGSGQAAEADARAQRLLARIRGDAEQYIRLRLASLLLARTMDRFRKENQGPVLSRASDLFGELTLGSFAGLRADYDDTGNAVLVGVRPGGAPVGVSGMSDGSRDQLYLSLRLALVESYLAGREPMPFIVDDILVMFDNERTLATLRVLARLAEKTQVIVFTHHDHLVQLASELPGPAAVALHQLDGCPVQDAAAT